jgi:integrase
VPKYQPVLAAAAWSGMRQSELLALRWCDVDFEAGFLRVSKQLSRSGEYVPPKTSQAMRDVVLTSRLGRLLREHRLASAFSGDDDPVFASATGRPLSHRNVQSRGFDKAAERAGINPKRKRGERKRRPDEARRPASFHDLRHTFASHLIAAGEDVVQVSRQLGHADPSITLRVYAHEFAKARHAERNALPARRRLWKPAGNER